ncbi:hypothetical protein WJX79_001054 [Trebouxia sp. C0005]
MSVGTAVLGLPCPAGHHLAEQERPLDPCCPVRLWQFWTWWDKADVIKGYVCYQWVMVRVPCHRLQHTSGSLTPSLQCLAPGIFSGGGR